MNRDIYISYIEERLFTLCYRIEQRGKLNVLNYHLHSENFYRDFLNLLYGWKLENLNNVMQNVEAIDLIDETNKIFIQVSATNTKKKIDDTFKKSIFQSYTGYTFKFVSIARTADGLRKKKYCVPQNISFTTTQDMYDLSIILKTIYNLDIDKIEEIYNFIKKELGVDTSVEKLESNLTTIIKLLAKEDLNNPSKLIVQNSFEIDRKIEFNKLKNSRRLINVYKIYQGTVDKIYSFFDQMGQNRSLFVSQHINKIYISLLSKKAGDDLFQCISEKVCEEIRNSANFQSNTMTIEEMTTCVDILIVDTFIRCNIFENPENYKYVVAR